MIVATCILKLLILKSKKTIEKHIQTEKKMIPWDTKKYPYVLLTSLRPMTF